LAPLLSALLSAPGWFAAPFEPVALPAAFAVAFAPFGLEAAPLAVLVVDAALLVVFVADEALPLAAPAVRSSPLALWLELVVFDAVPFGDAVVCVPACGEATTAGAGGGAGGGGGGVAGTLVASNKAANGCVSLCCIVVDVCVHCGGAKDGAVALTSEATLDKARPLRSGMTQRPPCNRRASAAALANRMNSRD
jgi:hypothetical protein